MEEYENRQSLCDIPKLLVDDQRLPLRSNYYLFISVGNDDA